MTSQGGDRSAAGRLGEAQRLERDARALAQQAQRQMRDWPVRRRMFWWRSTALVLSAGALALWFWPALPVLALALAAPAVRRLLCSGTRGDLARSRAQWFRAVQIHDRLMLSLVRAEEGRSDDEVYPLAGLDAWVRYVGPSDLGA